MKLPTLDELIGIDKFNLTESQKHDCRSLANHRGMDAAVEQAKVFASRNNIDTDSNKLVSQND